MRISILGLGYIGLPTAIILAKCGHEVYGYDVNPTVIHTLNSGHIHIVEKGLQEAFSQAFASGKLSFSSTLHEAEVYIISVPTPFKEEKDKKAELKYIDSATESIAKVLKSEDLVILESTSPPMTTKRVTDLLVDLTGLGRDSFYTAHCPERVLPGKILYELENNDRIIGAERKEAAELAKRVYEPMLKKGNIYLTDDITAEMTKLVENSYRDVNIAFANELSILCDTVGIDVNTLINLANKHPRVNILNPGIGVGGHCISVDPWFLVEAFDSAKLIKTARLVNDNKPYWVAKKIEEKIEYDREKVVGILGLSFKPNIDDLRESPSEIVIKDLLQKGYRVIGCEPNINNACEFGIDLYPLEECYKKSDALLLAQAHDEFINKLDMLEDKLITI